MYSPVQQQQRELKTKTTDNTLGGEEKCITHVLTPQDTLQGLALKYGSSVADIKRINKIWTQDTLHIKKTLLIPVKQEDGDEGSSSSTSNNISRNNSYNSLSTFSEMRRNGSLDSNTDFFTEFNNNTNKDLNNYLNNNKYTTSTGTITQVNLDNNNNNHNHNNLLNIPLNSDRSGYKIPISTLSISPLVNTVDEKTLNQFSLIDDELNPL
ncbi:peptidoglycan-binding LysM domain-containing protein [Cavenderia fasciculata]|uniref:Peptidoglycan-binding LysM domain-containing protein n=1 Tax=Cavenderia fasciculata TaxID=261658 RepID=F4PJP9_CACFS|nr:peptidoglycan-binding LysM domain-containing protein [Cavenderia fasciculata]EGG23823.1 peptidoglycan-binding LysM domain-containing protein [Cavenderia fasciculata]|eukprot:XP_004361674.1 peptidoglycan-binding LysM domain-containing protein [Cavenderia fasciculata]